MKRVFGPLDPDVLEVKLETLMADLPEVGLVLNKFHLIPFVQTHVFAEPLKKGFRLNGFGVFVLPEFKPAVVGGTAGKLEKRFVVLAEVFGRIRLRQRVSYPPPILGNN